MRLWSARLPLAYLGGMTLHLVRFDIEYPWAPLEGEPRTLYLHIASALSAAALHASLVGLFASQDYVAIEDADGDLVPFHTATVKGLWTLQPMQMHTQGNA